MTRFIHLALVFIFAACLCGGTAHAAGGGGAANDMPVDPLARKITGSANYLSMFGIRASITSGFTVSGFIAVDAGLDVPDSKVRKHIMAIRPRIVDAMRRATASYVNGPYVIGETPNLDILRARMQRALDRQIGAGQAEVMLASVMVFEDR